MVMITVFASKGHSWLDLAQ